MAEKCWFCEERKPLKSFGFDYFWLDIVDEYGDVFIGFDNSAEEYYPGTVKINYCPMCGKKFEPKEETE